VERTEAIARRDNVLEVKEFRREVEKH